MNACMFLFDKWRRRSKESEKPKDVPFNSFKEGPGGRKLTISEWIDLILLPDVPLGVFAYARQLGEKVKSKIDFNLLNNLLKHELRQSEVNEIKKSWLPDNGRLFLSNLEGVSPAGYDALYHRITIDPSEIIHRLRTVLETRLSTNKGSIAVDNPELERLFSLVFLKLFIHEAVHSIQSKTRNNVGLMQILHMSGKDDELAFEALNEGVVDIIADRVMEKYLASTSYCGLSFSDWNKAMPHELQKRDKVKILATLFAKLIAQASGVDCENAMHSLERAHFRGLNLLDPDFVQAIDSYAGEQIVVRISKIPHYVNETSELDSMIDKLQNILKDRDQEHSSV